MEAGRVGEPDGDGADVTRYAPPRVERVLTPAELEREFLYAGRPDGSPISSDS